MQDEGDRQGDARRETAARKVMPAQEQVNGEQDDEGEDPAHHHAWDQHGLLQRVALRSRLVIAVGGVLHALLAGIGQGVVGGTEAAQQGEDRQADNAQNRDLAEGVEGAEVHQDDVDDVAPARVLVGVLDEEARNPLDRWTRHDGVGNGRQGRADGGGDDQVDTATAARPLLHGLWQANGLEPLRQPAQTQQQQDGGHDLDQQLGHGQIRRRQPDEGQATGQTCAAHQNNGGQPVIFRLPSRRDRTTGADQPKTGEGPVGQCQCRHDRADHQSGADRRQPACQQGDQDDGPQLCLLSCRPEQTNHRLRSLEQASHGSLEQPTAVQTLPAPRSAARVGVDAFAEDDIETPAAGEGDKAQHQRQVESVPQGQTVIGQVKAQHRNGGALQERPHRYSREDADDQAQGDQHLHGAAHPGGRLVRDAVQLRRRRAEEGRVDEAQ